MLQAMQQPAGAPPAPPARSFAELLAALETPSSAAADREPVWSDEGFADDYATLSYERALRAHARYRPQDATPSATDSSLTQLADPQPTRISKASPAAPAPAAATATPRAAASSYGEIQAQTVSGLPAALDRNLKSASITIRLSKAESEQLRRRASEAGLTVSAYLRSCTFEAESLRAQVKDALSQMRSGPSMANRAPGDRAAAKHFAQTPGGRSRFQWWKRLWPWAHSNSCMAQA